MARSGHWVVTALLTLVPALSCAPNSTYEHADSIAVVQAGSEATQVDRAQIRFAAPQLSGPKRAAAMTACEACDGEWGPQGRMQLEGCRCRTSDAGKRCTDGSDCEGRCFTKRDPMDPMRIFHPIEFECSPFLSVDGCFRYLPDGWSGAHKPGDAAPQLCVD